MLLLAPLLGLLPNATLAAVVIVYSVGLIHPVEFLAIRKVRTMEFRWAIIASLISLSSQAAYPRVLAVDMSRVPDIEYSALQMLIESDKRAIERGAVVWLVGLNPGALEVVRNAGLDRRLGRERMLFNTRAAIERYQALQAKASGAS